VKPFDIVAIVGASGLLVVGAYAYSKNQPKAEKTVAGVPPMVPVHQGVTSQNDKTSLCQVLTGYRTKLKQYQDLLADSEKKMRDLESYAQAPCRTYAKDPVFKYHCNGFPRCGNNEWWTVSGTQTNGDAYSACMNYLHTGVSLYKRAHLKKEGDSWDDTWEDIDHINSEIAQAYDQIQEFRKQYLKFKQQAEQATALINELQRKIADLEAQGVFC
jgi:hypothetical protein